LQLCLTFFRVWSLIIKFVITFFTSSKRYTHSFRISASNEFLNMKSTLIVASLIAAAFSAPATLSPYRRQAGGNFQTFTGALGGITATPVQDSGNADRKFSVKGDTFVNIGAALQRSCDQQFNACANAANGGDATLSVSACSAQKSTSNYLHLLTLY
jgi:hypothetical protein